MVEHCGRLRLDVALMHHVRVELTLDDDIGLGKALLQVAALVPYMCCNVCRIVARLAQFIGAQFRN